MDKELALILSIMSLMAVATFVPAAIAQDSINATVNDTALNNTTLNNTTADSVRVDSNSADNASVSGVDLNSTTPNIAPISDMAKVDPVLAATASSVQVASEPEDVFKLGEGIGGRDLFEVKENGAKTMEIGIPIKPLRDVGKMVFVCDIV